MTFTDEQQADIKEIIKATLEVELPIILKLFAMQHEINDQVKIAYEKIEESTLKMEAALNERIDLISARVQHLENLNEINYDIDLTKDD